MPKQDRLAYHRAYHAANRERLNARAREYYQANKVRMNGQMAEYAQANAENIAQYQKRYRNANKEQITNRARERYKRRDPKITQRIYSHNKTKYRQIREELLRLLGGKCYCCGIDDLRFLTIDHVDNDGTLERKSKGYTTNSLTLIRQMLARHQQEPGRYRAACYNCNCARHYTEDKICPHQKQ